MGEGGTWIPLGSFADRGFANGEGGIMTRGDCGLTLRLVSEIVLDTECTDSVELEVTDVVEDSELVELVRESVGCTASGVTSGNFSSVSSIASLGTLSLKRNFELVPVVIGLVRPVDIDFKKSK
jgi:hypothetical protein